MDFLQDMKQSIANYEKQQNSKPRRGMMVYLDKNTPILVQYADEKDFNKARVIKPKGIMHHTPEAMTTKKIMTGELPAKCPLPARPSQVIP